MPWVRCREVADYQKRATPSVYDFVARGVFPDLPLHLICLDHP